MKYTFSILIDGNYYDEDEEFEKDIELSDDEIAAIKKLVDDYESDLSCGLIPILEAGSEELYHKFYDAIFPHVFFVLFQRDPCFEPEPGDENKIWDEDEDIEYLMETYGGGYDFDDAFVVYIPDEMMPPKPTLTKSMTNEDLQKYINKWYHNIQESIFDIIRWGDHAFSNELNNDLRIIINDKLLSYLNQTIKDNNDEVIAKTDFEPFTDDIQKKIANEAFDELKEKNDPKFFYYEGNDYFI